MKYLIIFLFSGCLFVEPKKEYIQVIRLDPIVFRINADRTGIDSIYYER